MSRGLRNNNPLNIRLSATTVWQGEIRPSQDRSFCQFRTMAHGYRAGLKLLQNYRRKYGCRTIADFIRRWAPPTENNTCVQGDAGAGKPCARCGRPGYDVCLCGCDVAG